MGWLTGLCAFTATAARAGVFTTPTYLEPKEWAIGIEPELVLSNGAGFGGYARLQMGVNDLSNANFFVGAGSGPKGFRIGANMTFDLFPDNQDQPGVGVAFQAAHQAATAAGRFELQGIPYISKSVHTGGGTLAPFLAIPLGLGFSDGTYSVVSSINVGASMKTNPRFRYVLEVMFGLKTEETAISGGLVYYP